MTTPRPSERKAATRRFPIRSAEALKDLALRHVARFPCTTERLKKYLRQKMRDAVLAGEARASDTGPWIENAVAVLTRVRALDDAAFAGARAATLHRRGRAERFIGRDLAQKGIAAPQVEGALATLEAEVPDTDLVAAVRLAMKKKLGPWAPAARRIEHRQRHFAALARSGFTFAIARRVIDARDAEALEALVV